MKEILPGILHWTTVHPKIKIEVSSYYLVDEAVLVDPLMPEEGIGAFHVSPEHAILTNRHHYRHCDRFEQEFGCKVWCVESGLHEFKAGEKVEPFRFGDELPGGILAVEIGAICPDETALWIPGEGGIVALADGVIRRGDGPLSFVPDEYMGDDPEAVKKGLQTAYRKLCGEREFEHLLLAHGDPWIGGGRKALLDFVG